MSVEKEKILKNIEPKKEPELTEDGELAVKTVMDYYLLSKEIIESNLIGLKLTGDNIRFIMSMLQKEALRKQLNDIVKELRAIRG